MKRSTVIYPDDNPEIAIIVSSDKYKSHFIVDRGNADVLSAVAWYSTPPNRYGQSYAVRVMSINNQHRAFYMHRVIAGTGIGMYTDHINGDIFDNRRSNLRNVTRSLNLHNRKRRIGKRTSKYLGVYFSTSKGKWCSHIDINKKTTYLGSFDNEYLAHLAYESKKRELLGEDYLPNALTPTYPLYSPTGPQGRTHDEDQTG